MIDCNKHCPHDEKRQIAIQNGMDFHRYYQSYCYECTKGQLEAAESKIEELKESLGYVECYCMETMAHWRESKRIDDVGRKIRKEIRGVLSD